MTRLIRSFVAVLFALLSAAAPAAFAQAQRSYSQAELDQMLAPVALYPDALLSQVLMAATYPDEVADAARWARDYPGLPANEAVRAVENRDWDPSVKSLVAFPQVLSRMDENIAWTRTLGDAFLGQEAQVMDTVQQLRWRAQGAGNLQSDEQIRVEQQGQTIVVHSASPHYVHVPYYDPLIVYGPWWWRAYQPVAWAPWAGYVRPYRRGYTTGIWWGQPVGVSASFFFGNVNWRERRVRVVHDHHHYRSPRADDRSRWLHHPPHRRVERQSAPAAVQRTAQPQLQAVPPAQSRAPAFAATQPQAVRPRFQPQVQQQRVQRAAPAQAAAPQAAPALGAAPRAAQAQAATPRAAQATREERREQRQERGRKGG
jgi:hypothetical protein